MNTLALAEHRQLVVWLRPYIVAAVSIVWPLLGLLFVARRLSSDLQPLPGGALVVTGVVLAAIALALHRELPGRWGRLLPPSTLALFALALSIPGTHPAALTIFWLLLIGEEVASGWFVGLPTSSTTAAIPVDEQAGDVEEEGDETSLLPRGTSQQITRTRTEDSQEALSCRLRVSFAAGEQTQTLHVAFCPALEGELRATSEHLEGAPCEIKLAQVESFGARLEVKRRGALQLADEAIIQLQVIASR